MPQVTGRGCNLTTGTTDRSLMGRYLTNRKREKERERERGVSFSENWFPISLTIPAAWRQDDSASLNATYQLMQRANDSARTRRQKPNIGQ